MSTPKVEYRQLGKSGLRVSVPIVSPVQNVFSMIVVTLSKHVVHIARWHELWFTEMGRAFALPCHEIIVPYDLPHSVVGP